MPYEVDDKTWVSVTVEMDLNRMDYSRSRYTAFDLLSDVGGLSIMLTQIFAIFLAAWNYNVVDNFMVSRLFRIKTPSIDQIMVASDYHSHSKEMIPSRFPNCKQYLLSFFFCCKPKDRKEKAF